MRKALIISGSLVITAGAIFFLWCAFADDYARMMTSGDSAEVGRYLRNTVLGLLALIVVGIGVVLILWGRRKSAAHAATAATSSAVETAQAEDEPVPDIPGAEAVRAWYGEWPSFHDARILEIRIVPEGVSVVQLANSLYRRGNAGEPAFVEYKHATVTFRLEELTAIKIGGRDKWGLEDDIFGLELLRREDRFELALRKYFDCGYDTELEAKKITVEIQPQEPASAQQPK